jgi:hypothetical protein
MKNSSYFFIILFFLFGLISCQEDGIVFPSIQNAAGSFQVTIDGALFSTKNVSFTSDNVGIFISAIKLETNETVTLKIVDFNRVRFSFEGEDNIASYIKNDPAPADVWSTINATSSRGTIEFTDIDFSKNTVSGSFSFIAKHASNGNMKAFTTGVFVNVPIL